jgi:hypothetical protein
MTRMSTKTSLTLALAGSAALLAFAAPAANAATTAGQTTSGTQAQASACFTALDNAAENLDAAGYDVVEFGPWSSDYQTALTEMQDPVCAPFASLIQAPIASAESLAATAASQASAGDTQDASNNFQSASNALAPAWWAVYEIAYGLA